MQLSLFDGSQQFKIDKPIRLIELFAGIGSQAKALKNIGANFEHYRICEFDKYAVASYNAVHGTNFETSDITKITADDLGIVDTDKFTYLLTYSFPCQDLSSNGLGKGMAKGSGTRSGLLWEVERLLDECKELPQVLVMENVPEVIGANNIKHFAKWIEKLERLGYKNKWQILNAKDYGIPQNRERCFMVSILGDYYYTFSNNHTANKSFVDCLEDNVDNKYVMAYLKNNEIVMISKSNHLKTLLSKIDIRKTQSLDTYNQSTHKDFIQTIRANINSRNEDFLCKDGVIRKYTEKECWRFMGFENNDINKAILAGVPNSQLYKQAGNSIVVQVLEEIFKEML